MSELNILTTTTIALAFFHSMIGVDHYIPFIALSQANKWTTNKTMLIVLLCGIGHVIATVAFGFVGIALSTGVSLLVDIDNIRGEIATYFLIAFGLVYTIYGIRCAIKNKAHRHAIGGDSHVHEDPDARRSKNLFWGMFIFLVLGPCEPLIPIFMYPAATQDMLALVTITASFAAVTIATMLLMTFLGLKTIRLIKMDKLERYSHVLAGSAILICGISVLMLPI